MLLDVRILVVDDDPLNRELLTRSLQKDGCEVVAVEDGMRALRLLRAQGPQFDLVLLDVLMPVMDGYDVLRHMKGDAHLGRVPVIVISGLDDIKSVVKCLELGADDYVTKPFEPVVLRARISNAVSRKLHADVEERYLRQLEAEEERTNRLILNILPDHISTRLKAGESVIADHVPDATVLFADLVGFTDFAARRPASELVTLLNHVVSEFDELAESHGLEKIKTIGDAYMAAGGLRNDECEDHLLASVEMAFDMLDATRLLAEGLQLRIGIHAGPVIAGVIGLHKFSYDLWGDTVNIASRMESHGMPGRVHVSQVVRDLLGDRLEFESRGSTKIKNRGAMDTYFLGKRPTRRQPAQHREGPPVGDWIAPDALIRGTQPRSQVAERT